MIEKVKLTLSPFDIYSRLHCSSYSFFLDSALESKKLGNFSFIGIEPFLVFKSKKDHITLEWPSKKETFRGNPFVTLKELFEEFKIHRKESALPFTGGGVGYFAYDLKDFNESLPDTTEDDLNAPDCVMCFYDSILAFDHFKEQYFIASTGFPEKGRKRALRQKARLEGLKNKILNLQPSNFDLQPSACRPQLKSNFTKTQYIEAVKKAKKYIEKGDIYQVNLSQRFSVKLENENAFNLYGILRNINPAPFASFLNFGNVKIASASPERFIKKQGSHIETRPIKGTRPRHRDPSIDARLRNELVKSVKDRAENLMIIDLERNDLGRISEYGSVRVTEFMKTEKYATVHHLVSTVESRAGKNITPIDCLTNCFPGGSITGAPKIRSMEIIEELEPVKRSVYTGSIGYIGFDGNMDTSIVIRTILVKDDTAYFHVGGGIVYDSLPEKEYQETLDKAKALIDAIHSIPQQKIYSLKES